MLEKESYQIKLNNSVEFISTVVVRWKIYSARNQIYWSKQRYYKEMYFVIKVLSVCISSLGIFRIPVLRFYMFTKLI